MLSGFHNFAACADGGSKTDFRLHYPLRNLHSAFLIRGHSSVGRAVALQAIGLGFDSPCLHCQSPSLTLLLTASVTSSRREKRKTTLRVPHSDNKIPSAPFR